MKAKEYVKYFDGYESKSKEDQVDLAYKIFIKFYEEMKEMIAIRGESDKVFKGIVSELDNKWNSMASKVPTLKNNSFRFLLDDSLPELNIKPFMGWA